ncbi:cytochrome P450 [Mycena maculata]|uniref:Cytochrome P450 n=1 Tax=Mycena maculata TaxID=230809 RepID=A0AAD7HLR1_9AGAR|nr:cytochrome P450 [Mycena maculata]
MISPSSASLTVGLGLVLYGLYSWRNRLKLPLPPGPRKLPLLGNLLDIPSTHPWITYMLWSEEYNSDIIHLDIAGKSVVVLSSLNAVESLLEKRSAIYSDRPRITMVNELMGWDFNLGMMKYGDEWRTHRRLFKQGFTPKASLKYRPKQLTATHRVLRLILHRPDAFMDHFRQWAGDVILSVAYGIDVLPYNDPYVSLAYQAVHGFATAGVPGRYLVDSLPILKHVPAWFPGAGFKRQAKKWEKLAHAMRDVPFAVTKGQMELGTPPPSFAADYLLSLQESSDHYYTEGLVKNVAGTMFLGGADTTVSAVSTFMLAMLANPDAQQRAQAEIDSVTKGEHLPDFEDEAALPYVTAIVKEVLRWQPVTPMAIPHFVRVEDEYQGYRIPAGSIVIGNTWAILHDEAIYPDPYAFKPERFLLNGKLNPAVRDPEIAFGYGRRRCPAIHMAMASVWITVVSILATFDITRPLDGDGKEIAPSYEYDDGFISFPLPFKCGITPRSDEARALIQATVSE